MFQRLKGVIDTRIAEEQARQRAAQSGPHRSDSAVRRPLSRNGSPARRQLSQRDKETLEREGASKGPDPAEFESAFVIGDEDSLSRAGTPKPGQDGSGPESSTKNQDGGNLGSEGDEAKQAKAAASPPELPPEVKAKLRRLDKIGSKYQELLRSYRIAHARVQAIEPFEICLRENTPLTSINEPNALVEYLNQLTLQGDMVMQELKRVTSERDDFKRKLADAEKRAKDAHDEAAGLRREKESNGATSTRPSAEVSRTDEHSLEDAPKKSETADSQPGVASPASAKSPTFGIGRSLFSPTQKPTESSEIKESEEFFSYDNELPRVQSELKAREAEVENYKSEMKTLQSDLAAAKESTESMTQNLEKATRELEALRDAKEKHQVELREQRNSLEATTDELKEKLHAAERDLESRPNDESLEEAKSALQQKLTAAEGDVGTLKAALENSQKEANQSKELEEKILALGKDLENLDQNRVQSDKRIDTLNGIISTLRGQIADLEKNREDLSSELNEKAKAAQDLRQKVSDLEKELELLKQRSEIGGAPKSPALANNEPTSAASPANPPQSGGGANKKKNRKKKKGGKATMTTTDGAQNSGAQSPSVASEIAIPSPTQAPGDKAQEDQTALIEELQTQLETMKSQLGEKEASIDRLSKKLKREEELREEIEGLKEDLVEVGQDHVRAKALVKTLQGEKSSLSENVHKLEQEITELRKNQESSSGVSQKEHDDLVGELEDFKRKTSSLQKELEAAEKLAASRFRELADLKEILQKAQPELTSLRTEVSTLRTAKTELVQKESDIRTLESRQESLRSEIQELRKEAAERDADIRNLREKADQESNGRIKAESTTRNAQSELRKVEGERQAFADQIENISRDLVRARNEASESRSQLQDLERRVAELNRESQALKEEIELKTAQHASAQSLMGNMRDQTAEMAMQMKEARDRCESLEEELGDAHRLLSERSREGETMRRLLSDVESRADVKVREMRERMEVAIEERDRAEEEASTVGRKRAREVEELRSRVREAERSLKQAVEDKEELASVQKEWQTLREGLEHKAEQAALEVVDVRKAMAQLRDALDESENQARDSEKQRLELKNAAEEAKTRLEKLQKANKSISEELRSLHAARNKAIESETTSTRTSRDSSPQPRSSRLGSDASSPVPGSIDYIYLKNVLLQFMEQREKRHQIQLIPVLATLLHFDRKDEQKWMSVISSR